MDLKWGGPDQSQGLTHIHQPHFIHASPYLRLCGLVVPPRYCVTEPFTGAVIGQKPAGEGHAHQAHHGTNHVPHQRRSHLQHQTHTEWERHTQFSLMQRRDVCVNNVYHIQSSFILKHQHLHQCSLCGPRCWFCAVLMYFKVQLQDSAKSHECNRSFNTEKISDMKQETFCSDPARIRAQHMLQFWGQKQIIE